MDFKSTTLLNCLVQNVNMINDVLTLQPDGSYILGNEKHPMSEIYMASIIRINEHPLTFQDTYGNILITIQNTPNTSPLFEVDGDSHTTQNHTVGNKIGIGINEPIYTLDVSGNVRIENPVMVPNITDVMLSYAIQNDSIKCVVKKGENDVLNKIGLIQLQGNTEIPGCFLRFNRQGPNIEDTFVSITAENDSKTIATFTKDGFYANVVLFDDITAQALYILNGNITPNHVETVLARAISNNKYCLVTEKGQSTNVSGDIMTKIGMAYEPSDLVFQNNSFIRFHRGASNTGGYMSFSTSTDLQRMMIDADGKTSFGSTAPVIGLVSISPSVYEPKLTLIGSIGNPNDHYGLGASFQQLNYHVDSSLGHHVFYAGGKNGDGTELMRISGNSMIQVSNITIKNQLYGNLISGTLTTSNQPNITNVGSLQTLTVVGNTNIGSNLFSINVSQPTVTMNGNVIVQGNIQMSGNLQTTGNVLFVNTSMGSVGINTSQPTSNLQVIGTANITGNVFMNSNVVLGNIVEVIDNTNKRVGINIQQPTSTLHVIGTGNITENVVCGSNVQIYGNLIMNGLYVDKNQQYVGIGTNTPTSNLNVIGTGNITGNVRVGGNIQIIENVLANKYVGIGTITPSSNLHVVGNTQLNGNVLCGTTTMYVDTSVNRIGINTITPTSSLHVVGNTFITGPTVMQNDLIVDINTFYLNSSTKRVGISTSTPLTPFHVVGNTTLQGNTSISNNLQVNTTDFVVNTVTRSVGIGIAAPTSNLHVIGTGNVTGNMLIGGNVIVNTNACVIDGVQKSVGIGVIPTSNLHVFGTGNVTGNMVIGGELQVTGNITTMGSNLTITGTKTPGVSTEGKVGDICWDDSNLYIKTSTGWKYVALTTMFP